MNVKAILSNLESVLDALVREADLLTEQEGEEDREIAVNEAIGDIERAISWLEDLEDNG